MCAAGKEWNGLPPTSVPPTAALRVGGGGGVQERLPLVPDPPPALERQAARVSVGKGCWCVAAGDGIAGGGSACLGGGGVQERLLLVPAPLPALKRPAARVSGGEGCWCVATGAGIASGGCAC